MYGGGLYSFFENYDQTCLATESCQENMVSLECSSDVFLWGLEHEGEYAYGQRGWRGRLSMKWTTGTISVPRLRCSRRVERRIG